MNRSASLGFLVLVAFVPSPAGADDPLPEPVEEKLCLVPQDPWRVVLAGPVFTPGQVVPADAAGLGNPSVAIEGCLRNNGFLEFRNLDPALAHAPRSARDAGACFDAADLAFGQTLRVQLHKHNATYVAAWVDGGPERDCSGAYVQPDPRRSVIPFECAQHPDTMRGLVIVKSF